MNAYKKFIELFGLTPSEGHVALVLISAFLLGLGVRAYRAATGGAGPFDYAASDSAFAARSAAAAAPDTGADDDTLRSGPDTLASKTRHAPAGKVNLNTATRAELIALPGVGEVTAQHILLFRAEHGRFLTVRDLLKVGGIGPKKFERLEPLCTTGE